MAPISPAHSVPHLDATLAALTAAHPASALRLDRAARLVAAGAVSSAYSIGWLVDSQSEPGRAYWVQRVGDVLTCACEDFRRLGGPCKHGWATVLFTACERLDAEQTDPTLQPVPYEITEAGRAFLDASAAGPLPAA